MVLRPRGPVRFDVTQIHRREAVWVQITGELDLLTAPKLATELNTVIRRSSQDVVVDLRRTEFIDSAGLQVLLGAQRRMNNASRSLIVLCDEGPVRRVFELSRLEQILGAVSRP